MTTASHILTILFFPFALWQAHIAGGGYILAKEDPRAHRVAVGRSLSSVLLMIFSSVSTGKRLTGKKLSRARLGAAR